MVLEFKSNGAKVLGEVSYDGPRGWIVGKYLGEMLESLVEDAVRIANRIAKLRADKGDYSDLLTLIGFRNRL